MLITILIIFLILSLITNILLGRLLYVQFKKLKIYENWIIEYEDWVGSVRNVVRSTYIHMRKIDEKDVFFKDDDVGVVFTELLNLLKYLNDRIQK
jgi:hypothetical protein